MCWKYEWAMSVNNLNYAILHIKRAQLKLHKRLLRNKKHLRKLQKSKKYNYPGMFAPVQKLIKKNREGEKQCKEIIIDLRKRQSQLKHLIKNYGIARKSGNKTTERYLKGRRKW